MEAPTSIPVLSGKHSCDFGKRIHDRRPGTHDLGQADAEEEESRHTISRVAPADRAGNERSRGVENVKAVTLENGEEGI